MFVDFGILTCANEHLNNVPVILKIDWLSIYTEECNNCIKSLKRVKKYDINLVFDTAWWYFFNKFCIGNLLLTRNDL